MLRNDPFARRPPGRRLRVTVPGGQSGLLVVLILASVTLLFLSRLEQATLLAVRWQLAELSAPVLRIAEVPLEHVRKIGQRAAAHFELFDELDRLRAENQRLRHWQERAEAADQRASQLARLARVVEEPQHAFATTRVLSDASGPFTRTVMLGAGRESGLKSAHPVIDADGLVGRIIEAGPRVSRVLLVTDSNSRIPVEIGKLGVRALVAGDNGPAPRIIHLPAAAGIEAGDAVVTSGVGGLFPRGLSVGTIIDEGGGMVRVKPHARLENLDFVTALLVDSPAFDLSDDDKPRRQRDAVSRRVGSGRATSGQGLTVP